MWQLNNNNNNNNNNDNNNVNQNNNNDNNNKICVGRFADETRATLVLLLSH